MTTTFDVDAYLQRIGHLGATAPSLETLRALHLLHPMAIPFENLDPLLGRPISLDLPALASKLVRGRRGGYCFEHNLLFRAVLQALGFELTSLIGRTLWRQPRDKVTARGHMLLQVVINGTPYLADVGFGARTLTAPLILQADIVQETPHGQFRLLAAETGYTAEAKIGPHWQPIYSFDLGLASDLDFEMASYYLSAHPDSPFTRDLMVARPVSDRRYALHNNRLAVHLPDGSTERRELASASEIEEVLRTTFAIDLPASPSLDALLHRLAAGDAISGRTRPDAPIGVTLRAAAPADDAACGRLISAATLAAPTAARLPHARALFEDVSPMAPRGGTRLVAVDADDDVLGFADFDTARGYIHYLFVAPEAQGGGIGTALLDAAQAACGGRAVALSCWAVNDAALAWYLRHGFAITGGGLKELAGQPVVSLALTRPAR